MTEEDELINKIKNLAIQFFASVSDLFEFDSISKTNDNEYIVYSKPVEYKKAKKYIEKILDEKRASYFKIKTSFLTEKGWKNANGIVVRYCASEDDLHDVFDSDIEKVMAKIEKLLSVANGNANEHESILAGLKAQRLMAKYHINMSDSLQSKEKVVETEIDTDSGNLWKAELANIIARNYCCIARFSANYRYISFLGHALDTSLARKMFYFMFERCKTFSNRYVYQNNIRDNVSWVKNTYSLGFIKGLEKELDQQCFALKIVIPDDVQSKNKRLNEENTDFKFRKSQLHYVDDKSAYLEGVNDGKNSVRNTRIHTGKNAIEQK
jgi:predicted nucleotide-binding protein